MVVIVISSGSTAAIGMVMVKVATVVIVAVFVVTFGLVVVCVVAVTIIVGAIYMLSAYKKAFFGTVTKEENKHLKDVNRTELLGLIPLVIVTIWLGVYPKPLLEPINNSVEAIVQLMHDKAQTTDAKQRIPDLAHSAGSNSMQEAY